MIYIYVVMNIHIYGTYEKESHWMGASGRSGHLYMSYICPLRSLHPSTEIPSQRFHIYVCSPPYIYLIILDADFDEDSDSDLRLEIGAHLDLVFEG